jgi:Holliday junction resolvase-like predicted endonuclease
MAGAAPKRTRRRRSGDAAEQRIARDLSERGWTILARNVRAGTDEVDLIAIDPGPPPTLVFVEVRSNTTSRHGAPEESVVGGKLRRTYRAVWTLLRVGALPDGSAFPRLPWRVDVVVVEHRPSLGLGMGGSLIRHLRAVVPE